MIISHRYKLIFIKTLKTAGTSIELALTKHCGPDDIITPIFPAIEGNDYRNFRGWFNPLRGARSKDDLRKNMKELGDRNKFYNHIPARFARARIPRSIWDNYLKVCVERNPWDKTLSHFHMFQNASWHKQYTPGLTLDAYLDNGIFCYNAPFYCDVDGSAIVDRILRYDRLDQELPALFAESGIPFDGLPNAKGGIRKDRRTYHEVLSTDQKTKIEEAFQKEIHLLNWEF
jgi:hypothetical protein